MAKEYEMKIKKIKKVNTPFRRIVSTSFPVPKSIPILKKLRKYEPRSMTGQPLALWDKAEGVNVYDKFGNKWLDFSCGVLVTNAGHGNPEIKKAIIKQVNHGLLHNYCFPSELRAKLTEKLSKLAPYPLKKVFLLTTGSETVEVALKLARTWGQRIADKRKIGVISFENAFHGRTLGSQLLGGTPSLKEWIVNYDKDINQTPFPNCFRCPWGKASYQNCDDECFSNWTNYVKNELKIDAKSQLAGVILETYQGGGATFAPKGFMKKLREYCNENNILLIMDEIQAGFGRTGKFFGFEHYDIVPDIATFGKGITSSLPLSAVIGRADVMDIYDPNTMTSTHTGNPVCIAAAIANIDYIIKHKLVENARKVGKVLKEELLKIKDKYSDVVGGIDGEGLVYGMHIVKKGTKNPDGDLAHLIVGKCVEKGLMLFAPVGVGGATIKISPPLVITAAAVKDGVSCLDEAIFEAKKEMNDK